MTEFLKAHKMKKSLIPILSLAIMMAGCHTEHHAGHEHQHEHQHKPEHESVTETVHVHANEVQFCEESARDAKLKTEEVTPRPFHSVLHCSGEIMPAQGNEQTIVASSNGIVNFTNASLTEGTAVRKGETIVYIFAGNLQDGDPIAKAKAEFIAAEQDWKRAEELVHEQIISTKEYEQARLRYETATSAYKALSDNITKKGISVHAPLSGYIKERLVGEGTYVTVGQPIATVTQDRKLQLRADVSEKNARFLNRLSSANFKPAYSDSVYHLTALNGRLLSYGRSTSGQASFIPVTFEFDNTGDIIPGSFSEVFLLSDVREHVISAPVSALIEEQGLFYIFVQTDKEIYRKQEVTTGESDGTRIEILNGLQPGDRIVVQGAYQIKLASASSAIPAHNHNH